MEFTMDTFFENTPKLSMYRRVEHSWPTHFHTNIEIFIVKKGSYEVSRNGEYFTLTENQIAFFDHYDLHSYHNKGAIGDDCVVIIPSDFSAEFDANRKGTASETLITDPVLVDKVLAVIDDLIPYKHDKYYALACINYILALIGQKLTFTRNNAEFISETEYIRKILIYINEHFKENISSTTIADHIGYSREYTSRLFNKFIKESIPSYINRIRADYINSQKAESNRNLTSVILDAGFNHPSSYYRFLRKTRKNDDE